MNYLRQFTTRTILAAAVVYLLCPAIGAAQFYFDRFDTDSGLPQNSVGAVRQTRDGYLWLATLDGLARFDGVKFKVFTVGNSRGIVNNRFRLLHETPDGALWAGTEEFGVTRFWAGEFQTFGANDGLPDASPIGFGTDADGSLLVLTAVGIGKFNGERFEQIGVEATTADTRACAARGGGLWLFDAQSGLRLWRGGAVVQNALAASPFRVWDFVPVCYEDRNGAVLLAGSFGEIFKIENGVSQRISIPNLPTSTSVLFIAEDRAGNFWFGTNKGLFRFADNRFERFAEAEGLSDENLLSFAEDREGTIWLGTSLGGLNRLNRRAIRVLTVQDGLAGDSVYPIYQARDGAVWVGANGVTRIKDGEFTRFTFERDGVHRDTTAIFEDTNGRIWLGTSGGVGFLQNGKFTDYRHKFVFPVGTYTVWAVHQDRTGAIWFGTSHGLVRMTGENFEVFTVADNLPSNDVKTILETRDGRLWFGTYGGILTIADCGLRIADCRKESYTTANGLSSNLVRSLFEDADGTLWIGTYDGGLNRLRDGRIAKYSTENGLFSDGVFQILPDDAGFFWMSSNQGIYRVRRQELEDFAAGKTAAVSSEAFGKRDGLLNTECNGGRQPAGIRVRDGRLWFPTQQGAAVVDPNAVEKNALAPPVVIENLTIDGKIFELNENISISPNQTNLEIAYTGLSFVKPEQMRFRYKLEGLDANWVEAGTRRTAYFAHLPVGEYVFRVTAANNSGVWNSDGASLKITVHPPFYRTVWFVSLVVLGVAGVVFLAVNRRFAQLRRERAAQTVFAQKLIAAQESERQRIAGELHDGLGQNLLVIKNWALLALQKNNGDEILAEISGAASQSLEEARRIAYNLRPYQIEEIGLTRALQGMLKRVAAAAAGEIKFEWQVDEVDNLFTPENEINLYRIVQECLNNIVRHSAAAEAKIKIERTEKAVEVFIGDNGKGFAPESLNGRRGLGLTGIEERARMIGGASAIQSTPNEGTKIQIKINL